MPKKREAGHWEPWEGGRKWVGVDGKVAAFYIRRRVGGVLRQLRLPCTTESAAHAHLKRFEADPLGYDPAASDNREALLLDDKLVKEYLDYSEAQGNSAEWRRRQRGYLAWWADHLDGIDLRKARLRDHILPALKDATARHHRIAVIKALYAWLRAEVHRVAPTEDPTFGVLKVPQVAAAQLSRSKVVPRDHVLLVIEQLRSDAEERKIAREERARRNGNVIELSKPQDDGPWADALAVQAGTGWHTTEVLRFAELGSIEPVPRHAQQDGVAGILVCPQHKSGEPHRTRVSTEVLEAAKRVRKHGTFSRKWYDTAVRDACKRVKRPDGETGIPVFAPGRLRHSVATWAVDAGADLAAVSTFLGHKSPRTTRRFYATHASAAKVPTLI